MTESRDPDRLIRAWLDLMPSEAPDRVVSAVLHAIDRSPQRRTPIGAAVARFFTMNRLTYAAIALAIVVIGGGAILLSQARQPKVGDVPTPTSSAPSSSTAPSDSSAAWIAYEVAGEGIRLVHVDGSGDHPLLEGGFARAQHPSWSSDGEWLTFVVPDDNDVFDIWVARADGTEARVVFDCEAPCVDADGPAFSPGSTSRIAFRIFDQVDGVYTGSRVEEVTGFLGQTRTLASTEAPQFIGNGTPVRWSPGGEWILYDISWLEDAGTENERVLLSEIAMSNVASSNHDVTLLTDLDTFPTYADWSPSGDRIVFMARSPVAPNPNLSPFNLFTIRPPGEGLTQLTFFNRLGLWGPTWSPDDSSIFVTVLGDDGWTIGRVGTDGTLLDLPPAGIVGAHPRLQPR